MKLLPAHTPEMEFWAGLLEQVGPIRLPDIHPLHDHASGEVLMAPPNSKNSASRLSKLHWLDPDFERLTYDVMMWSIDSLGHPEPRRREVAVRNLRPALDAVIDAAGPEDVAPWYREFMPWCLLAGWAACSWWTWFAHIFHCYMDLLHGGDGRLSFTASPTKGYVLSLPQCQMEIERPLAGRITQGQIRQMAMWGRFMQAEFADGEYWVGAGGYEEEWFEMRASIVVPEYAYEETRDRLAGEHNYSITAWNIEAQKPEATSGVKPPMLHAGNMGLLETWAKANQPEWPEL